MSVEISLQKQSFSEKKHGMEDAVGIASGLLDSYSGTPGAIGLRKEERLLSILMEIMERHSGIVHRITYMEPHIVP